MADEAKPDDVDPALMPAMGTYSLISWVFTVVGIVLIIYVTYGAFTEPDPFDEDDAKKAAERKKREEEESSEGKKDS
jgi:hypothetical protein